MVGLGTRFTQRVQSTLVCLAALGFGACTLPAQVSSGGRFDLTGPRIDVHVQRGEQSLPIALVPNLQAGDRLTIHADLPSSQSVKLILVVAFLRGNTNPPTEKFFTKIQTWDKKVRSEGATVTVPDEAQQALLFLAPETGGDYSTLKSAVMGRPGVFVRAAQDLNEASFEQARIERYLQAIRRVPPGSSSELLDHSHKLAATLNLKPNEDCFKKSPDQQLTCLRQTGSQVLLDDGHGQTLASMLATGDSANLIGAVATTPMASGGGAGAYSAYVGTVIDVVRLMSGLHTAQFQYIPAIAFPDGETLNLRLNTPPSFHNPKSVIVVALPAIQHSVPPPLRLQDPLHVSCLLQPAMVLPLEGAPLVFATGFAHDLTLHLNGGSINGKTDLPVVPDAFEGGLVLAAGADRRPMGTVAPEVRDAPAAGSADHSAHMAHAAEPMTDENTGATEITGTLRGSWGFDTFEGVTVPLQRRTGSDWSAASSSELYAGRANQLVLRAAGSACASEIDLDLPGKDDVKLQWKQSADMTGSSTARALDVKLPLEKVAPGSATLLVHQYGTDAVAEVAVTAYSDRAHLDGLHLHAGDTVATLKGSGLAEVATIKLGSAVYAPLPDQPGDAKELRLSSETATRTGKVHPSPYKAGDAGIAEATLRDGRTLPVAYSVDAARPSLTLLNHSIKLEPQPGLPLMLAGHDLPLDAVVTFAIRSAGSDPFSRAEKIEIALADGSLHALLTFADGSLVLQDSRTALAFLSPGKAFGASAYGALQMRPVLQDGTVGDWVPLGTLVRLPTISGLACARPAPRVGTGAVTPDDPTRTDTSCTLSGTKLFLLESVAADSTYGDAAVVPLGFAGETLPVPHPADNRTLYLRLRDDPAATVTISYPMPAGQGAKHATVPQSIPIAAR